jgi:hypothetical protein
MGYHLAHWQLVARPKHQGGWGLKQLLPFGKALAAKILWNLISKDGLWKSIISQKHMAPISIIEWIRSPIQQHKNASNQWKALILVFPLIG